jgi:hypothetical protein
MTQRDQFLHALEQSKDFVATMTGIKQQFVEAGWSEVVAEHMTYAMLMASQKASRNGSD